MLLGVVGISAFGLTLPATRLIAPYLDPIFIGLGRAALAAFFAAALLFWFHLKIPTRSQITRLFVVALGVVVGFPVLSTWAMQYVPASHGGVVVGILPLATALVGVLIGPERPSISFWIVGILGCGAVITYSFIHGSGDVHRADVALLGAIISAAIGYAVGAKLAKEMGGWQVICWALVLAFPFIIAPTIYFAPRSMSNISVTTFICFIYLALISQLFAFFVWYKGLALGGIARVSQTQLLQPFITLFASVILLGEVVGIDTIVFAFVIIALVWIGKSMPVRQKA